MTKINFQNLPNTTTPVNATNLNALQTNVETAINGVVESGTGTNSYYVKYADGTMICVGRKETGTITWTADPAGAYLADGTFSNFPATFYSAPYVSKSIEYITPTNRYVDICGQGQPSTTNAGSFNLKTFWNATNTNVRAVYVAIGRWKA
jgi:hypothetical protein